MNDLKIREAAVADIPQMCSLFQNDLGYAECTQEIVEKQFAGNSLQALMRSEKPFLLQKCRARLPV